MTQGMLWLQTVFLPPYGPILGQFICYLKSDKTQSKHSYRHLFYTHCNNNIIMNWFGKDNQIWYCDIPQFEHT